MVMSNAVMARMVALSLPELRGAEKHGRRLDSMAKKAKVRDDPSLVWAPESATGDPLALSDRLADHVADHFVPKGRAKALHMIVKLPASVPVATVEEAEAAMRMTIDWAQGAFGGDAVFAARMDRDERTLNVVDLFLAPRYEKVTKRASKPAISQTRHTKLLADRHGRKARKDSAKGSMQAQGSALQDDLTDFLTGRGFEAIRGTEKETDGDDWRNSDLLRREHEVTKAELQLQESRRAVAMFVEETKIVRKEAEDDRLAAAQERQEAEKARQAAQQALETHQRAVRLAASQEAMFRKQTLKLAAKERAVDELLAMLNRMTNPIREMVKRVQEAASREVPRIMAKGGREAIEASESDDLRALAELTQRRKRDGR